MNIVSMVDKVLSGSATAEEQNKLDAWRAVSTANQEEFEDLKLLWESSNSEDDRAMSAVDLQTGFQQIMGRIGKIKIRKKKIRQRNLVLTSLVAVMLLAVFVWFQMFSPTTHQLSFRNAALTDVVIALKENYQVSLQIEDKQALDCQFSGIFFGDLNNEQIVRNLAEALDLEYAVISRQEFKLIGFNCQK